MAKHRDILSAELVEKMASLGGFKEEINLYGMAFFRDHTVRYCVGQNLEKIESYRKEIMLQDLGCFPIIKKRIKVQGLTEERFMQIQQAKKALLKEMKMQYEPELIRLLDPFFQKSAEDHAKELFTYWVEEIDGNYEELELQQLEGHAWTAFERKILTLSEYKKICEYVKKIRFQMRDNPVPGDIMQKTIYGFAYKIDNIINVAFDAEERICKEKYYEIKKKGFLPGPILHKKYYYHTMKELESIREEFRIFLQGYCGDQYFAWTQLLFDIPLPFSFKKEIIAEQKDKTVQEILQYFNTIWA